MSRMDLPILDFTSTYLVNDPVAAAAQPEPWSERVLRDAKDAKGYLSLTQSRPAVGRRRLMQADPASQALPTVNNLPVSPLPAPVFATMSGHGNDVRMLPHDPGANPAMLTVFPASSCTGVSVLMAPGMDGCAGSPVQRYPTGSPVARNIGAVLVPAGLRVAVTDGCEYSAPVDRSGAFDYGAVLAQLDNSAGAAPRCLALPAGARGSMLRVLSPPAAGSSPRNSLVTSRVLTDGRIQVGRRCVRGGGPPRPGPRRVRGAHERRVPLRPEARPESDDESDLDTVRLTRISRSAPSSAGIRCRQPRRRPAACPSRQALATSSLEAGARLPVRPECARPEGPA